MSWQSSAVYHEARANELQKRVDELEARNAQLEDELTAAHEATQTAYEFVKPPVNIDTGTRVSNTGAGSVSLPDPAKASGLAIAAAVVGVLGIVWLIFRKP